MEHIFSVQSLGELKDVMSESGGSVYVTGRSRPADGGGGLFQWVATSDATSDDGIVVAGRGKAGRWHRVELHPINVRWFGAAGDGADSTDAIQRALNAAQRGGTVHIPSGSYHVTQPLRIYQGTTLTGDGLLTQLQYAGSPNTGCSTHRRGVGCGSEGHELWTVRPHDGSPRKSKTAGFHGPGDGQSPYYNVFTGCHVAGPGDEDTNGCSGFNFTWDVAQRYQSANANQVIGGHINSCQIAVACYGTGNVFYGQVFEQCHDGYVFGLPPGRLQDASKGAVNSIAGCYTEYVKRVIVQEHESCVVTAELTHTTGYETIFDAKDTANSVVLTSHDGRLEASRSLIHRRIDLKID